MDDEQQAAEESADLSRRLEALLGLQVQSTQNYNDLIETNQALSKASREQARQAQQMASFHRVQADRLEVVAETYLAAASFAAENAGDLILHEFGQLREVPVEEDDDE